MLQFGASLTDDTSIIIYDCIIFMIQAPGWHSQSEKWILSSTISMNCVLTNRIDKTAPLLKVSQLTKSLNQLQYQYSQSFYFGEQICIFEHQRNSCTITYLYNNIIFD
jgi:hypothetical protein